jgi:hypothetical protein
MFSELALSRFIARGKLLALQRLCPTRFYEFCTKINADYSRVKDAKDPVGIRFFKRYAQLSKTFKKFFEKLLGSECQLTRLFKLRLSKVAYYARLVNM